MKKNNSPILNSRWKSFIKPVFTLMVVAIPAILIWIFFSSDLSNLKIKGIGIKLDLWVKFLIAIAFIVGTTLITLLFIYIRLLDISIFMFSLPITICFMVIFLTDSLALWARAIIIIPCFFLIIPIAILIKKIELKLIIKKRKREEIKDEKIIGHK